MVKVVTLIALLSFSATLFASESVSLIEVFTNDPFETMGQIKNRDGRGVEVVAYDLSAPKRFNKHLSKGLKSKGVIEAKKHVIAKIQELPNSYLDAHVMLPYKGVLKAMEYELTKIPAIVFNNGESVIYGVTDIKKAMNIRSKRLR